MPQISLIIPLYNAEKYLVPCLESVAKQTFRDFEVLCINDGSKDKTEEIVKSFVERDSRFKLINQENGGCSVARNHGIEIAESPYIAFLDQDDMLHPQAFETLYYMVTKYKTDVAGFKNKTVPDDFVMSETVTYDIEKLPVTVSDNPFMNFFKNKKGGSILVWNRLYSKAAVKDIEFPKDVQPAEDTTYTLKVMFQIKSIAETDAELLFYRDSSTSVMNQGKTENYIKAHALAAQTMFEYFVASKKATGKELELISRYLNRFIFKSLVSQPLRLIKDKERQEELMNLAHSCTTMLYEEGAFNPSLLKIRKNWASKLFLKKQYFWARILLCK